MPVMTLNFSKPFLAGSDASVGVPVASTATRKPRKIARIPPVLISGATPLLVHPKKACLVAAAPS